MSPAAADPHAGHVMPPSQTPAPAEEAIPTAPPPPPPSDHAADRDFDPAAMTAARAQLRAEHGDVRFSKVIAKLAEYQARSGPDGYRWDAQASFGGDVSRVLLKSEGEGTRGERVEAAELQALYSRAVTPYLDLHAGVRQDVRPRDRTYATVGVEGLFPYWLDLEGALFLSSKGELLARAEGTYDLRLTQRLILQPRAELNFAAQDTRATRTGSGLSNAELGLRLRYEIRREFAPYIGVSYDRRFGRTADFARAAGEDPEVTSLVVGLRTWF
jgi:copper resistance protein B